MIGPPPRACRNGGISECGACQIPNPKSQRPRMRAAQVTRAEMVSSRAMDELNRREFLAAAVAAPAVAQAARPAQASRSGGLVVCMHEATSDRFDFQAAMEGWAKAGIRAVEPNLV